MLQRTSCPPVLFPASSLASPPDARGWQFYHPTSRRVLSSQDVTFDELVSYYHPAEPVEVAVDSGAARGAEPEHVEPGGAEPGGAESGSAEPGGAEPKLVEPGAPLSTAALEWYTRRCPGTAGAASAAGARGAAGAAGGAAGAGAAGGNSGATGGAASAGAMEGPPGVGATRGAGAAGPGGARTGGTGAAGAGGAAGVRAASDGAVATAGGYGAGAVGVTGAGGAAGVVAGDHGAEGIGADSAVSGGAARPYYVPLLQQVLGLPPSPGPTPPLLSPPPVQSQSQLQPASPLPGPSPYSRPTRGLKERREPESRPVSPESRPVSPESRSASPIRTVRAGRRVSPCPSAVSSASSLPNGLDPESDSLRAASPTVMRFLATAVTDPLFESTAASALVAELVDFAAACRLDYATSLVAESASASVSPPSVEGECAFGTDVLEDRQEEFECFAAAVPHLVSMLLAPEGDPDAPDIPNPRSYAEAIEGTYVDKVPPPGANIVSGMWIFRVKRPPGSPPVFKARYVARGFSQRQRVDFFHTFSPTPKMTTLWHSLPTGQPARGDLAAPPTWLHWSFPAGTQWSLRRPVYGLRQAPHEWHDTLKTTLAALGFAPSTADPSLFLRTDTTLPPFYVLVYVDDLVFATADTEALAHVKSELQKRHTCTDLVHRASGSCLEDGLELSSLVTQTPPGSSCEAEIYAGAMAAQELRWLTYLLTDLGEAPCSPPVLYVDDKAMLALCQEHRLEHCTKHIALHYFLARELQQRGQLHLAYVASQANTADVSPRHFSLVIISVSLLF
ncbi:unnamed protein product [Closterium sp. NIES-53]